jgi:hypothetical protein
MRDSQVLLLCGVALVLIGIARDAWDTRNAFRHDLHFDLPALGPASALRMAVMSARVPLGALATVTVALVQSGQSGVGVWPVVAWMTGLLVVWRGAVAVLTWVAWHLGSRARAEELRRAVT